MLCPSCQSHDVHRSRRRGWERLLKPLFVRAHRCHQCDYRFLAFAGPRLGSLRQPSCSRCGNPDLTRTSGRRIHHGLLRRVWRILHIPAYYCDRCRAAFFDLLWFFHRRWAREHGGERRPKDAPRAETAP